MSDNTNEIILEVKDLKKSFGDHVVLESINTTAVSYTHLTLPTKA